MAIYIYMADGDEYYGSAKARSAYENLHDAYENADWSDADIDKVLRIETPGNAFFNEKDVYKRQVVAVGVGTQLMLYHVALEVRDLANFQNTVFRHGRRLSLIHI